MEEQQRDDAFEDLNVQLNDDKVLADYKRPYDDYRPSFLPRMLGKMLVLCGDLVYGREPSYRKFRAVEVIARVPYHSWVSAAYTLLTFFYVNERKARELSEVSKYARYARDNETMHVVVISQLARREGEKGFIRCTVIPMLFAFFYYWSSYFLFLINRRYSFELNYMFENHAFEQYSRFLELYEEELRSKRVKSDFLRWYGRNPRCQYDFFVSIRNDEIIHRNRAIREIEKMEADDIEEEMEKKEAAAEVKASLETIKKE